MTGDAKSVAMPHPLAPEERVRANLYALVARLYAAPADQAFLDSLASAAPLADDGSAPFPAAYNRLVDASRAMDPEAAEAEYTELFVGVGKAEVNLHGSHWRSGFMMDRPLAELRADLAALGISRQERSTLLEDHLAALAETMRLLIAGAPGRPPAPLAVQRRIFETHVAPWALACCDAIVASSLANYYRRAAEFTRTFLAIERDSFAMD
ncbi:MAG: molecular chaperone TorD family protein [Burkholderiales bacterium]